MADISKEDLKKEIAAYLKGKDLSTTSTKKVRTAIEEKLEINLTSRKKEVDEIVMACIKESEKKGGKKAKKNGNKDDDDEDGDEEEGDEDEKEEEEDEKEDEEEEEEEEEKPKRAAPKKTGKRKSGSSDDSEEGSDAEDKSDEEYSPTKKAKVAAKAKKGAKGKKKKGSDSDSDEDWKGAGKKGKKTGGKRGGGGGMFTKTCTLTPELAAVVGSDQMARHEVVKKVWSIIKEKNLYDPKNKQYAICNDELMKVIGTKRFRTFGMMKYLKKHFVD